MATRFDALDWNDLKFFLAIARAGTIRGAAGALRANHATVSRRLSVLEGSVNARLFDRSKSGLSLTQLGEDLLPIAEHLEAEVAKASRLITGRDAQPAGAIHLSVPPLVTLSSIIEDIAAFERAYPDIDIRLDFTNSFARLDRHEADVSIRYTQEVEGDLIRRKLMDCTKAAYCTPEIAAGMTENEGEGLTFLGWNEADEETSPVWLQKTAYPKARVRHRAMDVAAQLALAAAGTGLTYLPCFMGDRYPGLVRAPFQRPVKDRTLWLLLHDDLRRTVRVRLFLDFLAKRILSRRSEFWVDGDFLPAG